MSLANKAHRTSTVVSNGQPKRVQESVRTSPDGSLLSHSIEKAPLASLKPATLNDAVYKPVSLDDQATIDLGHDIRKHGLLEPIVATLDDVIVSGHRRRAACFLAGQTEVPVRRLNLVSTDPAFPDYLVSFNRQRVKTTAEMIREEVVRTSPDDAHNKILAHRKLEDAKVYKRIQKSGLRILNPTASKSRAAISDAKRPMLNAAIDCINKYRDYWPLTLRQIHYRLLTRYVLRNAKDTDSLYRNTQQCYKDLSDLLTRARLAELVPWESMHDPTRPSTRWVGWDSVGPYMREQLDTFLQGYHRNLLQSQPAYVELVVEKLAALDIAKRAASKYHVPVGVGKGYTSTTCLDETADRFFASGKDRFVLLIAGDFDPEGENICETWAAKLHDEHGVENITTIKVGVNPSHVTEYNLSPLPVKEKREDGKGSSRAAGFIEKHGRNVYELEAFEPSELQSIIRKAILDVIDIDLFREEQRKESEDARTLMAHRKLVLDLLKNSNLEEAA